MDYPVLGRQDVWHKDHLCSAPLVRQPEYARAMTSDIRLIRPKALASRQRTMDVVEGAMSTMQIGPSIMFEETRALGMQILNSQWFGKSF
jgi:hypothetical protein